MKVGLFSLWKLNTLKFGYCLVNENNKVFWKFLILFLRTALETGSQLGRCMLVKLERNIADQRNKRCAQFFVNIGAI